MTEFFNDVQAHWSSLTLETQAGIRAVGVLFVAFLAGHFLGKMTARLLRAQGFDAALRLPSAAAPTPETSGITPTFLARMLVCLTVCAVAAWWLAGQSGKIELAERLSLIISRTWAVAGILTVILAFSSVLAQRLVNCLREGQPPADAMAWRGGVMPPRNGVADAAAAGVYLLVALVVLLIAADMFDWPLTRSSAQALWQLAQKLLTVAATLVIGLLGARWAREIVAEPAASAEKRAGQYTGLGILGVALLLSLGVLLSNASLLLGIAILAGVALALWLVRGYLPDLIGGLQLRAQKIREVWFDGVAWQVADIGLLRTQVCREGMVHSVQNRTVLDARLHGAAAVIGPQ